MEARFIISAPDLAHCPPNPDRFEFAMVGRSNVGKSSLINAMVGRRQLAKTSNTPGKTRLINFFEVDPSWLLVDLPGYGYAKVSKAEKYGWDKTLGRYLTERDSLSLVLLLVDGKIGPQPNDVHMAEWLTYHSIPFAVVLTKADQPRRQDLDRNQAVAIRLGGMAVLVTSTRDPRWSAQAVWLWLRQMFQAQLTG